jgi:hypothetical protein
MYSQGAPGFMAFTTSILVQTETREPEIFPKALNFCCYSA